MTDAVRPGTPRRALVLAALVVVALGVASAVVVQHDGVADVRAGGPLGGGGDGFGSAVPGSKVAVAYSFGGLLLCTEDDAITLLEVGPAVTRGALKVDAVGVRTAQAAFGSDVAATRPLPRDMRPPSGFAVSQKCDGTGSTAQVSELALQIQRTGEGTASVEGLAIRYRAGGHQYRTTYPFTATLCDAGSVRQLAECTR